MAGRAKKSTAKTIKIHRVSYIIISTVFLLAVVAGAIWLLKKWNEHRKEVNFQNSIQAFYDPPSSLPSTAPGYLIRSEKMPIKVPQGGTAYRILYISQAPDGTAIPVSGMIFVPPGQAPAAGRKVIAWAHGTLGFNNDCTPSRNMDNPMQDMEVWLDAAMQRGYLVTTTDYAGIGTPGKQYYLIGKSEANDVINSVRAARHMSQAAAGTQFISWGHSQGGHSSLFTALEAPGYAPELQMMGAAAAAPAAELGPLFAQQYKRTVAWAIGPDAAVSWPNVYPNLTVKGVLTNQAWKDYKRLANGCLMDQGVGLAIRNIFDDPFFGADPTQDPTWQHAIAEQTPNVQNIQMPLYITQGLSDIVVLPNTTALLAQQACAAGKNITVNWLGATNHQPAAIVPGPEVISWMQDRFAGLPAPTSCAQPLPVTPAKP
jgi:alpha-beta hydrolase superfamily lysophospholipase